MKHLKSTIIKGLITILPLAVTCYLVYWFVMGAERVFEDLFSALLPTTSYSPGLGLLAAICFVYLIGLVTHVWLGKKLISAGESLLQKVPLVKTIYGSLKDLLNYFDVSDDKKLSKPVIIYIEQLGAHMLGFVTQGDHNKLPEPLKSEEKEALVAVYLPMSYQVGGYMLFVKKERIVPLEMSIEEAMQYAITAGVSGS